MCRIKIGYYVRLVVYIDDIVIIMREGKIINVNCRMFAIFIGRLRTVMARLAAIIGILIAKAKTDGPRQKYGGEHYRHKISGTMHSASNGFYDFHSMELYHNHCRKWQFFLKEPRKCKIVMARSPVMV